MQHVITAQSFLAFLTYFGAGLGILIASVVVVALITPHREFTLIRSGNVAAAAAFGGTIVGVALPLHAVISHSVSLADAAIWGAVAAAVQIAAYLLARIAVGGISRQITDNVGSAGIFAASISIAVGLINAAAMTP
jgi:putative membrane protein